MGLLFRRLRRLAAARARAREVRVRGVCLRVGADVPERRCVVRVSSRPFSDKGEKGEGIKELVAAAESKAVVAIGPALSEAGPRASAVVFLP